MPKRLIIGVDVGGTKIRAGAVTEQGKIVATDKRPTDKSKGAAGVMASITASIEAVWRPGVKAVGLGMAGLVDYEKGVYRHGPNLPPSFKNVPIASQLKRRFKVPVSVDNDVHCFTLAEAKFGAVKRFSSVVGLTLGTGIGGGIVLDGRLYRGRNNAAGELGHTTIDLASDATCGCGRTGHFEAFASGSAMAKLYAAATNRLIAPLDVENAAKNGDDRAQAVVARMASALADGLANVIHTLNPDAIVVGGSLANVDILWKPALAQLKERVIFPELRNTPVLRASLGPDANVIGAALITRS